MTVFLLLKVHREMMEREKKQHENQDQLFFQNFVGVPTPPPLPFMLSEKKFLYTHRFVLQMSRCVPNRRLPHWNIEIGRDSMKGYYLSCRVSQEAPPPS
jgi:hypothetical protein